MLVTRQCALSEDAVAWWSRVDGDDDLSTDSRRLIACYGTSSYTTDSILQVAVAEAITLSSLPIPPISGYLAIAFGILSIIVVYARYKLIPARFLRFVPNLSVFGLAFMVPSTQYAIAMAAGAVVTLIWSTKWRKSYARNGYAVPAGLIAGEGIGGLIAALLEITGVGGSAYGSAVGCVGDSYCG